MNQKACHLEQSEKMPSTIKKLLFYNTFSPSWHEETSLCPRRPPDGWTVWSAHRLCICFQSIAVQAMEPCFVISS